MERLAAVLVAGHCLADIALLAGTAHQELDIGQVRSLLGDGASTIDCSMRHDALQAISHSHRLHTFGPAQDVACRIAGCVRTTDGHSRPSKSAAWLVYHSTPLAFVEQDTGVCTLHPRCRSYVVEVVAKEKEIGYRIVDAALANALASMARPDVGFLACVSECVALGHWIIPSRL